MRAFPRKRTYFTDIGPQVLMKKIEAVKTARFTSGKTAYQHRIEEEPTTQQRRAITPSSDHCVVAVPIGGMPAETGDVL